MQLFGTKEKNPSLSRDKGTTGQARNLATGRDGPGRQEAGAGGGACSLWRLARAPANHAVNSGQDVEQVASARTPVQTTVCASAMASAASADSVFPEIVSGMSELSLSCPSWWRPRGRFLEAISAGAGMAARRQQMTSGSPPREKKTTEGFWPVSAYGGPREAPTGP